MYLLFESINRYEAMKITETRIRELLDDDSIGYSIAEYLKNRVDAFITWAATQDWEEEDICSICNRYEAINPRHPGKQLRQQILTKYGNQCIRCGNTDNLCIDHIVPYSKGGWTREDNLTVLCKRCNSIKGDRHE